MFLVQQLSKPNESGVRQVQFTDAEWDYRNNHHNWTRAMSFIPNWGHVWVRVNEYGDVTIQYGR